MMILLLLAQVATPPTAAPDPGRGNPPPKLSILVDPSPACTPAPEGSKDVVVCAPTNQQQRLPLRDDRGPAEGPVPVNPELNGRGALNAEGTPCAARQGGCQVGFGPPIVPILAALVGAVKSGLAKHPDKSNRVAIPLDDAPPPPSKIEP
ncbi:hypothetical protein QH494_20955 [Sphingomonas sp. AR_OL41]|jgi:hypothetical protein|uniref:hypothetical protein n=1 Tax=Sphingomonas sp. AR_OL41 TaxID=3042729 RepID=UPI00247FCF10|nr:hypothetical protein [Sphingomonas sp. AR_OL41]MDH7974668.1 hypothetical protein [Sphingomonas sp. AR_OL41]